MTDSAVNSLELAQDMTAIDTASLTPEDIAQLERLILDYTAVAMCGSVQPWGRKLRQWARDQNTSGKARLIGSGDLANAATAALANGTAAHGYELDDTHEASNSHPGAVVISAALAAAAETARLLQQKANVAIFEIRKPEYLRNTTHVQPEHQGRES